MNIPNNKRRRESQQRMESAFVKLLQERELEEITVTDICKSAGVNRTTFYANYQDIYALAEAVQQKLHREVMQLYQEGDARGYDNVFLSLFRHIRENQLFYKTYFKLERSDRIPFLGDEVYRYTEYYGKEYYGGRHMEYHITFFKSGLNAILKKWLEGGCRETPEEMAGIITAEYMPKGDYANS